MKDQTSSQRTLIVSLMFGFFFTGIITPAHAGGDPYEEILEKSACELIGKAEAPEHDLMLWYRQPARRWTEALMVGNGRLGAMAYGGVNREYIILNEDTIWAGGAINRFQQNAQQAIAEARQALFARDYVKGEEIVQNRVLGERSTFCYQTLGALILEFDKHKEACDYRRDLDLSTAITRTLFKADGAQYIREVFSSAVDQTIVVRFECEEPGNINFSARISRPETEDMKSLPDGTAVLNGCTAKRSNKDASQVDGVNFETRFRIVAEGGRVTVKDNAVHVERADSATLFLVAATDFNGRPEPSVSCERQLDAVTRKPFEQIRAEHIADYQTLFNRVELDLGGRNAAQQPLDERVKHVINKNAEDPHLHALLFQFGRYLLISSSRPGSLPANLQGLWENGLSPPWNCDYHLNVNLQMNYWCAEMTNLSECHEPLFDLIDRLKVRGADFAREVLGCRGWAAGHTTDAWCWAAVVGKPGYGMWVMGGAWISQHLWEHYAFGGDETFLRDRAYPVMKGAAICLLDWLVEDPKTGMLLSGPSSSPENGFRIEGHRGKLSVTMGPTMDNMIIRDLFSNCIEASRVLKVDAEFRNALVKALEKLPPTRISKEGRIMEWPEELTENKPGHRHISHLFGLHPGKQISPDLTPELAEAARKTLNHRISNGAGQGNSWARTCLVNYYARLHEGEEAYRHLLQNYKLLRWFNMEEDRNGFQIDGYFGATSGITEMLLQSHEKDTLRLLPAIPAAWKSGKVKGLRARGGITVDLAWDANKLKSVTLTPDFDRSIELVAGDRRMAITLKKGTPFNLSF
jgi:alpha-L-fucosidase 2